MQKDIDAHKKLFKVRCNSESNFLMFELLKFNKACEH